MEIVLEPGRAGKNYWTDVWRYRELLYILAWRDIAVRYKQTVIGIAWAVLRPALTMLVFLAFRRLVGLQSADAPDAILVLAAVLPWQFVAAGLSEASASLIGNSNLISKVYFPRVLVPCAAIVTTAVDFLVTLGILAFVMLWYGFTPSPNLLVLPAFVVLAVVLSLGFGLLLAALNVKYRDFRYIVPFIVQFGIFVSPIAFTTADVPERWRTVFALNPLVGIIDGFRWSILGSSARLDSAAVVISATISVSILLFGVWYFRRAERQFADVI